VQAIKVLVSGVGSLRKAVFCGVPALVVALGAGVTQFVPRASPVAQTYTKTRATCRNREDANGLAIKEIDPAFPWKVHVFMVDDRRLREISGGGIGALAPGFIPVFIRFSTGL